MKYTKPTSSVLYRNGTSSRDKNWVQIALAGLGMASGLLTKNAQQKQQEEMIRKQQQDAIQAQMASKYQQDAITARDFNTAGNANVDYYALGGNVEDGQNPTQNSVPVPNTTAQPKGSQSGYQTVGGQLVPIGNGVEKAIGNTHEENEIDGVSGIQLHDGEGFKGEIEGEEVLVDGQHVLSNRLQFDKKHTYAQKMEQLTAKRNKLEKRYDATSDKRVKNSIDRKLMGLNMGEEALFKHQEAQKEILGMQALNKVNTYAYGGKLKKKFAAGGVVTSNRRVKFDIYGNPIPDDSISTTPNAIMAKNATPILESISPANLITAETNSAASNSTTPSLPSLDYSPSEEKSKSALNWETAATTAISLIDNIGNAKLIRNTPKVPTPLLSTAIPLETRVNVNPQLAEIIRTQKANTDNILYNTSSSNNAKSNIVAANLAASRQANEILGAKENQELSLRNANNQNKQMVANANTTTMNQFRNMQFQRENDIQTKKSQNLANLEGDLKDAVTSYKLDKQFGANMMANLMDDTYGEKAVIFAQNKEFMRDQKNRDFIYNVARQKKNPTLLRILKDQYNFVE